MRILTVLLIAGLLLALACDNERSRLSVKGNMTTVDFNNLPISMRDSIESALIDSFGFYDVSLWKDSISILEDSIATGEVLMYTLHIENWGDLDSSNVSFELDIDLRHENLDTLLSQVRLLKTNVFTQ